MRTHLLAAAVLLGSAICACEQQGKFSSLPASRHAASERFREGALARSTVPPANDVRIRQTGRATNNSFQTLYTFGGDPDAAGPQAKMVVSGGLLYGTAHGGGANGYGAVFTFNPQTNSEKVIYSFTDGADGWGPEALVSAANGKLYGTSASLPEPGFPDGQGDGAVWSMTTAGAIQVLHSFTGSPDGANPEGYVVDVNGILYGTTFVGGSGSCSFSSSTGCGTVFSINLQTGQERVLYSFTGQPDGAGPRAGLVYSNGTLYGTTYFGGTNDEGTVFSITPSGSETVLHSFTGGSDGENPQSALDVINGLLYGTTNRGGDDGTLYSVNIATKAEQVVAPVCCGPEGGLTEQNGVFYATTSGDGSASSGSILSVTLSGGTQQLLYQFTGGANGGAPEDALTLYNGWLYGSTRLSGGNGVGTIFKINPSATVGNEWVEEKPMLYATGKLSSRHAGDNFYAIGGTGPPNYGSLRTVEKYEPSLNKWVLAAPMPTGRFELATALINDLIYADGGSGNVLGASNANEVYNTTNNTWKKLAPMPTAREGPSSAAIDGKVYVAGGWQPTGPPSCCNNLEVYDPATNVWSKLAPMPVGVQGAAYGVINNELYMVGGVNSSQDASQLVQMYDPSTNTWSSSLAPIPIGRSFATAAVVNDLLYVIGGYGDGGNGVLSDVEIYDPATNSWSEGIPLPSPREWATASDVNGTIYVAGGYYNKYLTTMEAFTP